MRVFLVRHAKAAQAAQGVPDELRELTHDGRQQARDLGERLAASGVRPAVVLTSPLVRARETAEEIGAAVDAPAEPDERLAPGATVADLRAAVAGRGDPVVVVGHQPDCGRIAAAITGEEPPFPTAGMCVLDL